MWRAWRCLIGSASLVALWSAEKARCGGNLDNCDARDARQFGIVPRSVQRAGAGAGAAGGGVARPGRGGSCTVPGVAPPGTGAGRAAAAPGAAAGVGTPGGAPVGRGAGAGAVAGAGRVPGAAGIGGRVPGAAGAAVPGAAPGAGRAAGAGAAGGGVAAPRTGAAVGAGTAPGLTRPAAPAAAAPAAAAAAGGSGNTSSVGSSAGAGEGAASCGIPGISLSRMCWSISRQPSKTAARDMRGLATKQSSMLRTAWRQAAPTARASAAWRSIAMPGVSSPSISQPLRKTSAGRAISHQRWRATGGADWAMVDRIVGQIRPFAAKEIGGSSPPNQTLGATAYSSPPIKPSKISRLWKMLNRLR